MRRSFSASIAGLVLIVMASGRSSANDLIETYRRALDEDATLQAAYFQRGVSIEARPQALAAFLPKLDANVGYVRQRQIIDSGQSFVVDPTDAANASSQGRFLGNTLDYGLTLSQTIWSFESFYRLREANFQTAQAEATFRDAQQNLILRVAQAYFLVLGAGDTLRTNQLARAAFGELLSEAQKRVDTGIGARTDLEEAKAFFDSTATSIIDAEIALEDARRALSELTSAYPTTLQAMQQDIPLVTPNPEKVDDWIATALDSNYQLASLDLKSEAAKREINVNRSKNLPSIALQGSYAKTDADTDFGGKQQLDAIGVNAVWPLFQGGLVASQVRQAKAAFEQSRAEYEVQRRSIERQTRNAYRGVTSGIDRVKAAQLAVTSNKAAIEASEIGLEVGTRTEFDLLNAQTNYYATLRTYLQTRYDYLTSVLTLKQLAGRLTEADLENIDQLLIKGSDAGEPAKIEERGSPFRKNNGNPTPAAAPASLPGVHPVVHPAAMTMPASADAVRSLRLLRHAAARRMVWV